MPLVRTLAGAALALLPAAVRAQEVQGRVTERDGTTAAVGTIVQLVDSTGQPVAQTLSREQGEFVLRAPTAGRYRVRVLRIGFRPTLSAPLVVATGQAATVRVPLAGVPVTLNRVVVSASRVCRLEPDSGTETADVWQEARKALTASVLSRGDRAYDMRAALFERQTDDRGRTVATDQWEEEGEMLQPFRTVSVDTIAAYGFVRGDPIAGMTYYGADAELLLSEEFARTHCLHLEGPPASTGDSARWLGLAFEPTRHDAGRPDLRGVLWVDRASSELRRLTFGYTDLPSPIADAEPGGDVEFLRLPNGTWVVSRWAIRMPLLAARVETPAFGDLMTSGDDRAARRLRVSVRGAQVSGGALLRVRRGATPVWSGAANALAATLVDTGTGAPRAGVRVELRRTARAAVTDSAGRVAFRGLLGGRYGLVIDDPVLDSLGAANPRAAVVVPDTGTVAALVELPPRGAVAAARCGTRDPRLGLLRVLVVDSATARPIVGARVAAAWSRLAPGAAASDPTLVATSRRDGEGDGAGYSLCAVPRGQPLAVQVAVPGRGTREVRTSVSEWLGYAIAVVRLGR